MGRDERFQTVQKIDTNIGGVLWTWSRSLQLHVGAVLLHKAHDLHARRQKGIPIRTLMSGRNH